MGRVLLDKFLIKLRGALRVRSIKVVEYLSTWVVPSLS
jgi:hypothetical protein